MSVGEKMNKSVLKTLEYHKLIAMLEERTSSSLGREKAASLLPSNTFGEVQEWIAETAEGSRVLQSGAELPLGGIRDIRSMLKKTNLGIVLEAHELLSVGSTLYAMRKMKRFFKEIELELPILCGLASEIEIVGQLENEIAAVVDDHGAIRDDASIELLRIRREIKQSQSRIKERLDAVLRNSEYQKFFQDTIITMRGDRYVVPIKQEYRQFFPGIVHDQSSSGATVFIEPMVVVNLNNDIKQLVAAEKHELERILRVISVKIAKNAEILQNNCAILAQVDFIFAKAKLAQTLHAVMPILNRDGYVEINQGRHPLIAADKVVPIDIRLGKEFNTLLITGPNTGGKTVSIKTLGLCSLMTQAGLFIPALSGSTLPVFQHVFADIGDEQSIEQSLSTFSAHMTHLVKILSEVESDDLVLIDEIGAGTDPEEGAALAMSILEHLMKIGTRVVATTHYSELKTFAYSKDNIENASVEFDISTLRPTYRLLIGIPGTSNAFAISKRLGLSESLILRARQLIDADHAQFEHILNTLETEKLLYEQRNAEIAEREAQVAQLENKIAKTRADLTMKKERILTKAQEDSANLIRKTRREAEEIIRELKEQFNDQGAKKRQQVFDKSRQRLKNSTQTVSLGGKDTYTIPVKREQLNMGDTVYITTLGQKGTIISLGRNDIGVQFGMMKTTVPISVCRLAEQEKKKKEKSTSDTGRFLKVNDVARQIDIRGMMVEEGEAVLSKYIDDAILAGLNQVIVIHGKGTGALRKGIRAYLKAHRNVQDISIAEMNEGGDGATVVNLM